MKPAILLGITIAIILFPYTTSAQLSQSVSVGTVVYANYFNIEKDRFFSNKSAIPSLSYRVLKGKNGLEANFNHHYIEYYKFADPNVMLYVNYVSLSSSNLGLSYFRNLLSANKTTISASVGFNANLSNAGYVVIGSNGGGPWLGGFLIGSRRFTIGLTAGTTLNQYFHKNWYATTSLRFVYLPTSVYNPYNLIWEVGIGYNLGELKRK